MTPRDAGVGRVQPDRGRRGSERGRGVGGTGGAKRWGGDPSGAGRGVGPHEYDLNLLKVIM